MRRGIFGAKEGKQQETITVHNEELPDCCYLLG